MVITCYARSYFADSMNSEWTRQMLSKVILLALVGMCLFHTAEAKAPTIDTGAIDSTVTAYMRDGEVPGVVIGVVVGDDIVYAQSYGVANASNGAPMPSNATFQIASVTKLFTASLMVALEQDDVLAAPDLVHDRLDALLELAAILGAGDHHG